MPDDGRIGFDCCCDDGAVVSHRLVGQLEEACVLLHGGQHDLRPAPQCLVSICQGLLRILLDATQHDLRIRPISFRRFLRKVIECSPILLHGGEDDLFVLEEFLVDLPQGFPILAHGTYDDVSVSPHHLRNPRRQSLQGMPILLDGHEHEALLLHEALADLFDGLPILPHGFDGDVVVLPQLFQHPARGLVDDLPVLSDGLKDDVDLLPQVRSRLR
mmetsp:Transcript_62300/g.180655  ORF Transcript_62300/g.180655 Transcript_62300/m.180655 type:complete len:216 (+) Transcript_62300:306-953(+)